MSAGELFHDFFSGNFSNAFKRLEDWWNGLPAWLKTPVSMAATAEFKILESLLDVAAQDVLAGGLTTESFVNAGKDIVAKLVQQNITTFNIQYVMGMLNLKVSPAATVVPAPLSTGA